MEFTSIFEVVRIKQEIKESSEPTVQYSIRSPEDAQKFAASYIADEDQEVLLVMMLNTKNQVVGLHRTLVGSLNTSIVHPRDVMKCAIIKIIQHPLLSATSTRAETRHQAGKIST